MKQYFLLLVCALSLSPVALEAQFIDPSDIVNGQKEWKELKSECSEKTPEKALQEFKDQSVKTCVAIGRVLVAPMQNPFIEDKACRDLKNEWKKLMHAWQVYRHCNSKP